MQARSRRSLFGRFVPFRALFTVLAIGCLTALDGPRSATGSVNFEEDGTGMAAIAPLDLAIADFNLDGHLDVVTSNSQLNGSLSIMLGDGHGALGPNTDIGVSWKCWGLVAADINADNKPDIIATNSQANSVSVLRNNGDGTFAPRADYFTGSLPQGIASGDFNGDGFGDFAVANRASASVSVFLNRGNGLFFSKVDYVTASVPARVAVADFNADGKADLAVGTYGTLVSILLGNGNGAFGARTDFGVTNWVYGLRVGDFNGDGSPDLMASGNGNQDGVVSVLLGNGDGTFDARTDYSSADGTNYVQIGDFDQDGHIDLVTSNAGGSASILLGDGLGAFGSRLDIPVSGNPQGVGVGDFDEDGWLDFGVTRFNANAVTLYRQVPPPVTGVPPAGRLTGLELRPFHPNPTQGRVRASLRLPVASVVRAEVFDAAGHRIASLAGGQVLPAGAHPLAWDGRTFAGRPVSAGLYFVRVRVGDVELGRRVVLLR